MRCPMRTNQYGNCAQCEEERCAWWDLDKGQCCIKTYCISSKNHPNTDILQAIEILKNHNFAVNELNKIIERM